MKRIAFFSLAICTALVIVWGIFALALAEVASDTDKKAEQHFEKAVERIRQLMYEDAIAEFEKVVTLAPESKIAHDAQYWIGQAYFRAGQFDAALSTFEKLIDEYPESAIIPVTQLMVERVQQAKDNEKLKRTANNASDSGVIIDPKTGVKYTKTKTLAGKSDVIDYYPTGVSLSPNGKFLLWGQLVVPLDGGEPFDLVDMPASHSSWSPDGKKVAFSSEDAICVVPVAPETGRPTGPAKKLLEGGTHGRFLLWVNPSWSPDSERIVFARRDKENRSIWTLSVKDGVLTQITDTGRDPIWSPDGKTIAYKTVKGVRGISPVRETWLVPAEGGTPRKISIEKGRLLFWTWSPDSEWLVYMLGEKLQFFRIADERVFDITTPEGVGDFFSCSPDGKKMLFFHCSYDYRAALKVVSASGGPSIELGRQLTLWPYDRFWSPDNKTVIAEGEDEEGNTVFWIIPLSGGDPFPLKLDVSIPGEADPASLSSDCRKLLFAVPQSDTTEDLYVAPVSLEDARTTGAAVMVFTGLDRGPGYPITQLCSWSPDGNRLAVIQKGDLWIASSNGDKPVQITKTPENESKPRWSPDGEMIAYNAYHLEKKEQALRVISLSSGEATKILDVPGKYDYAWSPDSKELALLSRSAGYGKKGMPFFRDEGKISAISVADGKTRQVLDLNEQPMDQAYGIRWSPDGRNLGLLGWKNAGDPTNQILIVPAEGGKVTGLAAYNGGGSIDLYVGMSWSPDGKWISYTFEGMVKIRPEGAIWEADFEEILGKLSD
jgi:Tol biopolymer transport system component